MEIRYAATIDDVVLIGREFVASTGLRPTKVYADSALFDKFLCSRSYYAGRDYGMEIVPSTKNGISIITHPYYDSPSYRRKGTANFGVL